ncbi:MAG: guanylate kinase [Betaproteobacteria bacterium]|nr:guanylate kinase [Betaproteobacteria bacterium]
MDYPGNLFVMAAPSGAGKSSLTAALLQREPGLALSVSYTTRTPRGNEEDGREYHFVSRNDFDAMIEANEFLEWAEVHGNMYGTSARWIEERMRRGEDVLLEIDWKGALQVRGRFANATLVFVLPPSFDELKARLLLRGEDSPEAIRQRLANAREEIAKAPLFDYVIINDHFDEALSALTHIVAAQRCRYTTMEKAHPGVMAALGLK